LSSQRTNQSDEKRAAALPLKLLGAVVGMFFFGFALVPLYDVICDITGLNGKTGDRFVSEVKGEVDQTRWVTVQFTTSNNANMPWKFQPDVAELKVRPGQLTETTFKAKNTTDAIMSAQAVPSVAPFAAAQYLHKTECFCFNQQTLAAGEELEMPLRFFIDQDLPDKVTKLTLSYTLFDLPQVAANGFGLSKSQ